MRILFTGGSGKAGKTVILRTVGILSSTPLGLDEVIHAAQTLLRINACLGIHRFVKCWT